MKHYCNPLNLPYRYQFKRTLSKTGEEMPFTVFREAADPTLILFKDLYYLFPSMTCGFFTSDDLMDWTYHGFGPEIPIYDYAPDVKALGEYLYFCASSADKNCSFYRSKDPVNEPFEEIPGTFPFWDPALFVDDDGRVYLYWGSSNSEPIYGMEMDAETMTPKGEKVGLVSAHEDVNGFERMGENHIPPKSEEQIQAEVEATLGYARQQMKDAGILDQYDETAFREKFYVTFGNKPYMEGVWMSKVQGKYYLQYAAPGTEYNVYGDCVYEGEAPLGPFVPAKNNPWSYVPDGFITGAGHGSTLEDKEGKLWHISTMRISHSEKFERRLGLWKAGIDADGELFCDQRYADWPIRPDAEPFSDPDWMLLSYGKKATASSGSGMEHVTDENIRTCWRAGSSAPGEWVCVDLGTVQEVCAVQIHFIEDGLNLPLPEGKQAVPSYLDERYMDTDRQNTRWVLEGSADGEHFHVLEDKSGADTDLCDDFLELENPELLRCLKLTVCRLPYGQIPALSGIRVFGRGFGPVPAPAEAVSVVLDGDLDMDVSWRAQDGCGALILWGYAPDRLYHSCLTYSRGTKRISALIKGQPVYVRVDVFNENGIAKGTVLPVRIPGES